MKTNQQPSTTTFKRLAIGATFSSRHGIHRKVGARAAFAIRPDGRGQTHARIPFAKNTSVTVVHE